MYPNHPYNDVEANFNERNEGARPNDPLKKYPEEGNHTEMTLNFAGESSMAKLNPRIGFVRKVYGIICCQLAITSIFCYLAVSSEGYRSFLLSNAGLSLWIISIVMSFVFMIMIFCCLKVARSVPVNYIILGLFTLCESHLVSYCCVFVEAKLVAMAAVMTLGVTLALTIYAMTTKTDLTYMGGTLFIISCGLLLFGIFALFTNNNVVHILYCLFGIILYGFYLIYDTQLIMGRGSFEISLDDYIIAAVIIYLDIIILFLKLLQLLKRS